AVDSYIVPAFGSRPVASISPGEVEAWAHGIVASRSPATARQVYGVLSRMYRLAVRDGWVVRTPCEGIRLPAAQPGEPHPLTAAQLAALAEAMPTTRDRLMTLVMGYGGLRWSEVAALRAKHVRAGRLRLVEACTRPRGRVHFGPLKSHQART